MNVKFGVHTGLQHTSIAELRDLWSRIEALGFDWISIWDHFYAADASGDPHCLEAVASHAALAATTSRVTCGSLVYSAGYRHPAVLANAMATLDQIADGRIVLGLGGGWLQGEYDAYGLPFGSPGERLRMLEEYVQCVRGLLTQDRTSFDGAFFRLRDAQCEPKPVQTRLPIWIGGGGEQVTLKRVAQFGDACNVGGDPDTLRHKFEVLRRHCQEVGRNYDEIVRSTSLNVYLLENGDEPERATAKLRGTTSYEEYSRNFWVGTADEIAARIEPLVAAGVNYVLVYLPGIAYDQEMLRRFAQEVMPRFS
jgi:F420-dependent oxidoreductase-like protein